MRRGEKREREDRSGEGVGENSLHMPILREIQRQAKRSVNLTVPLIQFPFLPL
jgi:hypothetical protein